MAKVQHPEWDMSASLSTFHKTWMNPHGEFKNMKILRNPPFNTCTECKAFTEKIMVANKIDDIKKLQQERLKHCEHVRRERRVYQEARQRAIDYKHTYLALIIDGMDQHKCRIPGANGKRDHSDKGYIKPRIVGVKVHGRGRFFYVIPPQFPHDSNVTISLIMEVLAQVNQTSGSLPDNLHIQIDNTTAANKTKVVMAWGQLLVQSGIFKSVTFGFLPVGHTHEDIDQCFSVIAQHLKRNHAHTYDQLVARCQEAFKDGFPTQSRCIKPDEVMDWKAWIDTRSVVAFQGITDNHFIKFAFEYQVGGRVGLQYKQFMSQEDWIESLKPVKPKLAAALQYIPHP